MSKLIVITYKRPALPIEEMTMDLDFVYDSEAYHSQEIADIKYEQAQHKFEDIDMFECEDYLYINLMKDKDAFAEFTRTGNHAMKDFNEDVEVGTDSHTETLQLVLEMNRPTEDTPFEYNVDIDDVGQIVFTPADSSVSFVDIRRLAGYDATEDVIEGNTRTCSVSLTANMIAEDGNFDWFCDIDEIGQAVVTPDAESTSFLSVSVDDSLNLVTESVQDKIVLEALEPGTEEFERRAEECEENINTLEQCLVGAISAAQDIENDFRALGCHHADIDSYMVRYFQNYIEDREGEVSCADFRRRLEEVASQAEAVEESVEPVNENDIVMENNIVMEKVDELDRHNIIDRFMKGDIGIFSDDGEPAESYIHLDELDNTSGRTSYTYYYDEETDAIVCYSGEATR